MKYCLLSLLLFSFISVAISQNSGGKNIYTSAQFKLETGNTYDLLELIPDVSATEEGTISIMGNGQAMVMIDDKVVSIDGDYQPVLQQLSLDMIKHIEVISTPSAKYDAEASGGIVNIVLSSNGMQGIGGNAALQLSTGNKMMGNAGINYKKNKWNLKFDALAQEYNTEVTKTIDMEQYNGADTIYTKQKLILDPNLKRINANISAEYAISSFQNVILSSKIGQRQLVMSSDINSESSIPDNSYAYTSYREDKGATTQTNLSYTNKFSKEESLKRELSIQSNYNYTDGGFFSNTQDFYDDNTNKAFWQANAQADYTHELSEISNFETGYRFYTRRTEMDYSRDSIGVSNDTSRVSEDIFAYLEQVNAVYLQWNSTLGQFDVNIGLRAELANTRGEQEITSNSFSNTYANLFPSAQLTFPLSDKNKINLKYNRSIVRPSIIQVNPFVNDQNPNNIKFGNPELAPTLIDNVELKYSGNFTITNGKEDELSHNYSLAVILRNRQDEIYKAALASSSIPNVVENSFYNLNQSRDFAIEAYYSAQLMKWIKIDVVPSYRYNYQDGTNIDAQIEGSSNIFQLKTNVNIDMWEGSQFIATHLYHSAYESAQGTRPSYRKTNLSVRQLFLEKKLTLTLAVKEPFNQGHYHNLLEHSDFVQDKSMYFEVPIFEINVRYNFGNYKASKQDAKQDPSLLN